MKNTIKYILAFAALMLCGGAWADAVSATPKLLVNLGTSTAVDGWLAYNTTGAQIPTSGTLSQNSVSFSTTSAGSFSSGNGSQSSQDFEQGTYVDIFGEEHTSLMEEVSASLGGVTINADVYKSGVINGGQCGHTATISGLDASKTYVVYVGMGYVKSSGTDRYHSFKIETSGYAEVDALEYVVTENGTATTKADHYQSFSAGTIIRPSGTGLMLVRLKGIKPTDEGKIAFTMPSYTAGLNFLAVAEIKTDDDPLYFYNLNGNTTNEGTAGTANVEIGSNLRYNTDTAVGGSGQSLISDGNSYVKIYNENGLVSNAKGWSISFWINSTNDGSWSNYGWLRIGDKSYQVQHAGGNQNIGIYPKESTVADNYNGITFTGFETWHHIALVSSGENITSYCDGQKVSGNDYSPKAGQHFYGSGFAGLTGFTIGKDPSDGQNGTARIDEVAIYAKSLTADEVQAIFKSYAHYVAKIGSAKYETLQEAYDAAQEGETITLLEGVSGLTIPAGKTVDAGNFPVSGAIEIGSGAELIVSGDRTTSGISGTGKLTVKSGTVTANNKSSGYAIDGVTVDIQGGNVKVNNGSGDPKLNNATFVLSSNGSLSNYGYVHMSGTITYRCDSDKSVFNSSFWDSPSFVKEGSGVLTYNMNSYSGAKVTSLKVNGGAIKIKTSITVDGYSTETANKVVVTSVDGSYTVYKASDPVRIGNDEYPTITAALEVAQSGQTVEVLADMTENITIPEGVIVDIGTHNVNGTVEIGTNAQLILSGSQTTKGISGSGKLVKNGTGDVKVGKVSNNSISGVTVEVNGGALWLGHSSVGEGAALQNCTFVLNGGTLKGYGWPNVNGVTFDCRQDTTIFSGTNAGHSINGGSFTKTGSGALTIDAHLTGSLTIAINGGSFTVSNNRSIANSVTFTQATLGSDDTWTAPNAFVISGTISGSGTFNADLTFNAGSTIDATNGTVSLADGKSLTFPEGELNLVGVENGDTIISNVTSVPNGLSTAVVKIGGEAAGHLEYDAEHHTVVYSTNTITEVTPNITDPANLDSNRNFIWTSGAIWNTDVGTLPAGARIVFDAAEIAGVVISGQTEVGEIYVTNSDTANHPFVFHNHTKEVDGTHEIDDTIDCLTATSINVETFNGELGLRVPIKGDIMFGPSTTLKFIAGADKDNPSKAYAYSITGRAAAIQVALDTDAEAGWFVVPESMYTTCQFAPQDAAVTLVYDVADGEKSTTSPISNNQGSIAKTGAGTLALTSNISQNVKVIVEEGTLKLDTLGNYEMKGHLIVREHAKIVSMRTDAIGIDTDNVRVDIYGTLDMNGTRWTLNRDHANDIYFYPGSSIEGLGQETYGALDNATANKTNLHFVKNGDRGGTVTFDTEIRFRDSNGYNAGMEIEEGMTVDYVNAVGFRTGSGTLNLTGGGVFNIAAAASINNLNKIKLGLGMTLNVAAGKTVTVEPIDPTTTVIVETVNQDESKTYEASPVVAKIIVDETTTKLFASVDTALAEATVDQVVTICANVPGDLTIPENKKVNAGSYTIGGAIAIGANATLTVSGDRTTTGIAGPGTFIVTSGTITAKNKSGGYAVDGATIQIDGGTFMISLGNDGAFAGAKGDASAKDATFVIGENGTLTNYGFVNLVGTITFDTAATKTVFPTEKGFRGTPAIVKSGTGTVTFNLFRQNDSYKFTSLTLNGGIFKLNSTVVIDELISGVDDKRVAYDEDTRTYSLVDAVTPIKPGETTEPQQTKPTEEELAQYEPTPVNAEAEAAGQASILKVVSKETAEGWVITVDLDETKMQTGKKVDDTAIAFANEGLAEIAGSTEGQEISIPATAVTPGAYYSIIYGDTPTALSSEGDRSLATSEGVTITVPAMTGKKVQFFRVKASAYPTAN